MKNIQKIVIVLLVIIAVVLGVFVYMKKHPQAESTQSSQSAQANQTKAADNSQISDEQRLLALPAPNASADEVKQHSELAAKLAVLGTEIEVGDCKSKPLVLQLKQAITFNLKNSGASKVSIMFDKDHVSSVDPGKTTEVKATLDHGPGLYGYRCTTNTANAISGFVLLAP